MELTQMLHRALQRSPCTPALIQGERRTSYRELHQRVALLAAALQVEGVRPGDRVALLSGNGTDAVVLMFACWWIGAVFAPQNTRWSATELVDALDDCGSGLLVADEAQATRARELASASRRVALLQELVTRQLPPASEHLSGGADLAALIYTGGTTGRSKGVMLTHDNLASCAICRMADNDGFDGSVALVTTPIFHIASITRLLPHLMAGGTCVLAPQFEAGAALALIERHGVTDLPVVPTMLQMLLEHADFRPERLRSVQRLSYGAAPSAGALLQRAQGLLPWAGLHQYYGMTESSAVATMSRPADHAPAGWASGRATSAGQACTLATIRIADESGADLPPGTIGEILLRGPTVSPGYWQRPEESARTFRDGWLHTGDVGRLDCEGCLHVVDRVKDMIVTGGENVYSAEVENALALHPAVATAAVIGIPHEHWGEAVHAVVVARPGHPVDAAALQAHCRALIAGYKVPKSVEFIAELPLTAAGKVAKTRLREKHWLGHARRVN